VEKIVLVQLIVFERIVLLIAKTLLLQLGAGGGENLRARK
jgi:hypothetical protein